MVSGKEWKRKKGRKLLTAEEERGEKNYQFNLNQRMLPFKNRLRKRNDFNRVYKRGRAVFSQNLTLRYIKNNFAQTRIGILVNKSFSRKAVQRNKMKRIIREAVREYLTSIEPNFDIVISCVPREKIRGKTDFSEMKNQVKEILKKSNLLKQ